MKRSKFAARNINMEKKLAMGSLRVGDEICSLSGLRALVLQSRADYYVVRVIDGIPFKISNEIWYNKDHDRHEIHAGHIIKWRFSEEDKMDMLMKKELMEEEVAPAGNSVVPMELRGLFNIEQEKEMLSQIRSSDKMKNAFKI